MASVQTCPGEHCSTIGVEAVPLERYVSIETADGERIVYDREDEGAWIQSNVYFPRDTLA